jgi:heat shock protein HtpX
MTGSRPPSLAGRAILALALLIGFYVLAVAVAAGLLYLPYAEWVYVGRLHLKLLLFCGVGAIVILWSLLPRWDRFDPPGPKIDLQRHRRLAELVQRVSSATRQSMPSEVYVVPQVNAWVAQRGGVLGLGSKRVMGLGLPLMSRLTVTQFAAVLAHEFGHYHGGDTALGPWIYRTRAAIGRTLANLGEHSSILQLPFEWYGSLFLRITHAISRAQELAADALAARVVGSVALVQGLKTIHAASIGFVGFWQQEYGPLLDSGYRAPFQHGFDAFMASPAVASSLASAVAQEIEAGKVDPYDTHPPLRERIAAVGAQTDQPGWEDRAAALSLLDDVPVIEQELLTFILGQGTASKLTSIGWEDAPLRVWAPAWRNLAAQNSDRLRGVTPELLARVTPDHRNLAVALHLAARPEVAGDQHIANAAGIFGASLATALLDRGWRARVEPGHPVALSRGGTEIRPFEIWSEICNGSTTQAAWREWLDANDLAAIDLSTVAAKPTPVL